MSTIGFRLSGLERSWDSSDVIFSICREAAMVEVVLVRLADGSVELVDVPREESFRTDMVTIGLQANCCFSPTCQGQPGQVQICSETIEPEQASKLVPKICGIQFLEVTGCRSRDFPQLSRSQSREMLRNVE